VDEGSSLPVSKQETRLLDYQPPSFVIKSTSLTFELYAEKAKVRVVSVLNRARQGDKTLCLDGSPYMRLIEVAVNGKALKLGEYELRPEGLTIYEVPDSFELSITTELAPQENTRLEGLYFSGGNFCTQCEAEGFRHITYYLDRPDVLAVFDVRIEADKSSCPVLLSNGNLVKYGLIGDGRHYAEWHDPHAKPCYLFALVAGNLSCNAGSFVTSSGRQVALNIYVRPEDLRKSDHALGALKRSMRWDEDRFGLEYDLDVYNIVAVSDFNMGAMENKGLNIFNTKYVLASPETATDSDFDHVEGVIGHEYFHNWTGNRVTCRDWFQLSLKEGLTVYRDQEFSSDQGSRAIKRIDDVRLLRMLQFSEDAGPLAHPIRPEKYIEINNFYTATVYNKGAEVVRMIHSLVGEGAFRRGMDLYFERHDGQAVTCEDFVCAMEDASGHDLKQFRLWYSQAGTPRLSVKRRRYGARVTLTVEQSCPATPGQQDKKSFHMPLLIGWLDENGEQIAPLCKSGGVWGEGGCLLNLRKSYEIFEFEGVPDGASPSLLRQFSAPVILEHDLTSSELSFLMQFDTDTFARWEAAQSLAGKMVLAALNSDRSNEFETAFFAAFAKVLDDPLADAALTAELLTLPSEIELGRQMGKLDAARLHCVRENYLNTLAEKNAAQIKLLYSQLATNSEYDLCQREKSRRRLRNVLLGLMVRLDGGERAATVHFSKSDNMTDRLAALSLICNSDFGCRESVLSKFYETWKNDDLVIDKWFAVQAQSTRDDTLDVVKALTVHKDFTIENPNRLRSLVTTYAMLNQSGFHLASGEGYRFLANMIVAVDAINPQAAARMVPPLGRWSRLPDKGATEMKSALDWILDHKRLSDDVRELCTKTRN